MILTLLANRNIFSSNINGFQPSNKITYGELSNYALVKLLRGEEKGYVATYNSRKGTTLNIFKTKGLDPLRDEV